MQGRPTGVASGATCDLGERSSSVTWAPEMGRSEGEIPFGNSTKKNKNVPFIVDLPIKDGDLAVVVYHRASSGHTDITVSWDGFAWFWLVHPKCHT